MKYRRRDRAKDIRNLASPPEERVGVVTKSLGGALANPEELARRKQFAKEQLAKWLKERYGDY